jgi:hypothetical protein
MSKHIKEKLIVELQKETLLQKHIILTKKSNQEGPFFDMCQKDHFVDLDKLIWTCLA